MRPDWAVVWTDALTDALKPRLDTGSRPEVGRRLPFRPAGLNSPHMDACHNILRVYCSADSSARV